MERIEKFEELIKDYIGPDKTVVDTKVTNLTPPGENYMSEILKIDVILQNKHTAAKEDLHLVAKLVTENDFVGSTSSLARNEVVFYKEILPIIKSFEETHGLSLLELFPNFVGGRLNLTDDDKPDENAVVILENLSEQGYENLDRHVGFNLQTAKLVLDDLATFHAIPLAIKLLEPEKFEMDIKPKCVGIPPPNPKVEETNENGPNKDKTGPPGPKGPALPGTPLAFNIVLDVLKQKEEYSHIVPKYENFLKNMEKNMKYKPEEVFNQKPVEPFATLMHRDMWINNTMQKFKDGFPVKNKFVDFQTYTIGSPAQDLIFLLFSSVQIPHLKNDLDTLIKHYYQKFSNILKQLDCYGPQFSYENFLEEMKIGSKGGIRQCMFMIPNVIFFKKGQIVVAKTMQEMTLEDMSPIALEKLILLSIEASERGWF